MEAKDVSPALRAAHMVFTLSQTMVGALILGGTGKVGSALIKQLAKTEGKPHKEFEFWSSGPRHCLLLNGDYWQEWHVFRGLQ